MLNRKSDHDGARILKLCRAYIYAAFPHEPKDLGGDILLTTLASSLATVIHRSRNTLFSLEASNGVKIEIPMDTPKKLVTVNLKGVKLCYKEVKLY